VPGKSEFCQAVQLGDALVSRENGILDMDEFASRVLATTGQYGSRAAGAVFNWVRPRTDSPRETLLRLVVLDAGFPEPQVNLEVATEGGTCWLDLAWLEEMIDLEFHGGHHFRGRGPKDDLYRRRRLEALGWTVIEVTSADLRSPLSCLTVLASAFDAAGRRRTL
jgi:hypothetical protein